MKNKLYGKKRYFRTLGATSTSYRSNDSTALIIECTQACLLSQGVRQFVILELHGVLRFFTPLDGWNRKTAQMMRERTPQPLYIIFVEHQCPKYRLRSRNLYHAEWPHNGFWPQPNKQWHVGHFQPFPRLILHLLIVTRHFGFHGAQNLPTTNPDPTTNPWPSRPCPGLELGTATGLDIAEDRQFFVLLDIDFHQNDGKAKQKTQEKPRQKKKDQLNDYELYRMQLNLLLPSMLITEAVQKSHFCHCEKKLAWPCFVILNFPPPQRTFAKVCRNRLGSWQVLFPITSVQREQINSLPLETNLLPVKQRMAYAHMNLGCMHQSSPFLFNSS